MSLCGKCSGKQNVSNFKHGPVRVSVVRCPTCNTVEYRHQLLIQFDPYHIVDELERIRARYVTGMTPRARSVIQYLEKLHDDYVKANPRKKTRVARLDHFERQFVNDACSF